MAMDRIIVGAETAHLWGREGVFQQYITHMVPRFSDNHNAMDSTLRNSLIIIAMQVLMDESSAMKMVTGISDEMMTMRLSA